MVALSVILISCNNSDSTEVDKSLLPPASATPAVNAITSDSAQPIQAVNAATPVQSTVNTVAAQPVAAVKTTGNSALNPAHGQPGHRCDIAVGAPLNSPVTKSAAPAVTQNVTTTPATVTATPAAAATPVSTDPNVKLNPAHGQPGHDCSIAVGAPLKKN